jgi:prepilin-type N-terminal cleavage/methylation domain-containing protein
MRSPKRSRNQGGFTLIELMIVIGLIGVIAAIAIPTFMTYQARSRRTEGTTNVAGIARAYTVYHADKGKFPDMVVETAALGAAESTLPNPLAHGLAAPSTTKLPWDAPTEAFFSIVGWRPEGNVFYTYDVETSCGGTVCTDQTCFTITAHGDVDGNGSLGAVMFVHPMKDGNGNVLASCPSGVGSFFAPLHPQTLQPIYDEPAVRFASDLY